MTNALAWRESLKRGLLIAAVTASLLGFGVWQGQRMVGQGPAGVAEQPLPVWTGDAQRVAHDRARLNGSDSLVESGSSELTCRDLIASYQRKYHGQASLGTLPADEQLAKGLTDGMLRVDADGYSTLGFIDRQGCSVGVVAFEGPEGRGSRYYAFRAKDGLRQESAAAPDGDVAGGEPPDCPRPPSSRRVLSLEPDAEGGRILMYESSRSAQEVSRYFRDQMPRKGWAPDEDAVAASGDATLAFGRQGRQCLVSAEADPAGGRTFVTLVYRSPPKAAAPGGGE